MTVFVFRSGDLHNLSSSNLLSLYSIKIRQVINHVINLLILYKYKTVTQRICAGLVVVIIIIIIDQMIGDKPSVDHTVSCRDAAPETNETCFSAPRVFFLLRFSPNELLQNKFNHFSYLLAPDFLRLYLNPLKSLSKQWIEQGELVVITNQPVVIECPAGYHFILGYLFLRAVITRK